MANLVLYTNPQSRGRIAHWMLEELGEPYDTQWMDYGPAMKSDAYLAINPMGKVPALTHGEGIVTEAAAICAYLAASFPERGLIPAPGTPALAAYYRWMFFAQGPLEQAVTAKAMHWALPEGGEQTVGYGSLALTLDAVERALENGPFVCGEKFTAVDVYLGSHLTWGLMFDTIERRPVFVDYVGRLAARDAAVKANAINEARMQDQT